MTTQERTSRREFLCLGVAAAASACGGCKLLGSRKADVVAEPIQGAIRLTREQSAALLASEGSVLVQPEGTHDKIIVMHADDGSLHAVSAICTHMGCTVNYRVDVHHIVCPCHGSEYTVDGANLKGPAKRPLKQYAVRQEDGQVILTL